MTTTKFSLLQYDIPERSPVENPSYMLRRFAVRTSLSVWIVPNERTPWPLLNGWTEAGITWHLTPFATDEAGVKAVLELATAALRKQVADVQKSAQKSMAKAESKVEETTDKALTELERKGRAIVKRAQKLLDDARKAAEVFGIAGSTVGLGAAVHGVAALATANQERAHLYTELARKLRNEQLRAAAQEGLMPAPILADAVAEETGDDTSDVVAAFRDAI